MDLKLNDIIQKNNLEEILEKNNLTFNELYETALNNTQGDFLNTQIGQAINKGLDLGLKILLPDIIDDRVVELKNNILESDAAYGIKNIVSNAILEGSKSLGLNNKNYETIEQTKQVVEKGKVLDSVYGFIDSAITDLINDKKINKTTSNKLTNQKDIINKNIENSIEKSFSDELKNFNKLEKYISNWKECYNNKDFSGMQKEYYKMNTIMKNVMPFEKTINEYRYVENMQKLIKNNNKSFDLTEEQKELAEKLFSI